MDHHNRISGKEGMRLLAGNGQDSYKKMRKGSHIHIVIIHLAQKSMNRFRILWEADLLENLKGKSMVTGSKRNKRICVSQFFTEPAKLWLKNFIYIIMNCI